MTGYTVHTGSSEKFVEGWDNVFAKGKVQRKRPQKQTAAKAKRKPAAKSAKKKKKRT